MFSRNTRCQHGRALLPSGVSMTRSSLLALGLIAAASCGPKGGTDVGNGATVKLNVRGYEPAATSGAQSLKLESGVELDAVWVAIDKVRLQPGGSCGGNDNANVDFEGPAFADLIGVGVVGEVPQFDIAGGDYCRLRVNLHDVTAEELPAGAPAELADSSVLVIGRRADGVPFTIRTDQKMELKLDATRSSFDLAGDEPLIIGFDLGALIDSVALDSFPGPTITIDTASTPSVVAQFDQALRTSPSLFRDENADGALSAPEHAQGKAIAQGQAP